MSDEITLIVGKTYSQGMTWLRQNAKKYKLDPQRCRVTSTPEPFKGLMGYNIIWLRGWAACIQANAIRFEAQNARNAGRIKQEIAP